MEDDEKEYRETNEDDLEFLRSCKHFLVFFELDLEDGQLHVRHYIASPHEPSNEQIEEFKEEVNTDEVFGCAGMVDQFRIALVELEKDIEDPDEMTDLVVEQLLKDMGYL